MSITYQAQKYSVKTTSEPIGGEDGARSFLAQLKEAANSIVVDGTMQKSRQEECLFHELVHMCDMSMSEWMVNNMGKALYGVLRENGLLVANIVGKVSDGVLSKAQAEALNEQSNGMTQETAADRATRSASLRLRVTDKPWDGDASGYTIEEWRRATLIHLDDVDPDLKSSHKLPVREPNGDISRNGCHAAAAVLGGARGGVDAPMAQKKAAARALVRLYRQDLQEDPPESMMQMAGM